MFGYVNIYKPELKVKDYYQFKAYYCGLCEVLKKKYGIVGQMTLTYDMTFLILLLTSLYEDESVLTMSRCMVHPIKKQFKYTNPYTEYAADMNILLSYHHFLDNWKDDKSLKGLIGTQLFKRKYKKVRIQYPRQSETIEACLSQLAQYEQQNEMNIDIVSAKFGEIMAVIFAYKEDIWIELLEKVGFFLGKFIYIMDAYDDLTKDIEHHLYNPLTTKMDSPTFEKDCQRMLTMMMAECTTAFEKLPCLKEADILRNILYVGVWEKFDRNQKEANDMEGKVYRNGSL